MRRSTLIACLLLFIDAPAFAQYQPAPQQAPHPAPQPAPQPLPLQPAPGGPQLPPSSRRIVPGASLAGINMGAGINLILTRFGRPSDLRETTIDTVYNFSRWGIVVYIQSGRGSAASTSNSLLKLSDELGVGYRVEDVLKTFGRGFRQGTVEAFPGMIYDDQGIAFGLDRQGGGVGVSVECKTAAPGWGVYTG